MVRGDMVDHDDDKRASLGSQEWLAQAPKVSDALRKGMVVSVAVWSGREIAGIICDWEQTGLLLDVHEPDTDSEGYAFLPWSSIERVNIREVAQRRVKFLQS